MAARQHSTAETAPPWFTASYQEQCLLVGHYVGEGNGDANGARTKPIAKRLQEMDGSLALHPYHPRTPASPGAPKEHPTLGLCPHISLFPEEHPAAPHMSVASLRTPRRHPAHRTQLLLGGLFEAGGGLAPAPARLRCAPGVLQPLYHPSAVPILGVSPAAFKVVSGLTGMPRSRRAAVPCGRRAAVPRGRLPAVPRVRKPVLGEE